MTISRESQVSLEATSFYHCYVRCVRRAYLCGVDHETGDSYEHRKQWLVSRIRFLSYVFAIDVGAYAVMSNHYHVVLHVNKDKADGWSENEVVERWLQLYKGNMLVDRWLKNPAALSSVELDKVSEIIELWRERLYDISWFMRGINEKIARMANEEDNCKGRYYKTHPCVLPLRAAYSGVQKYSRYFCGRADLRAKPCLMKLLYYLAWPMLI